MGESGQKMEQQSISLNQKAWKRLKRNRSAMFGLFIVAFATLLAVFAYAVAPDNSPSANEQILQLETHPPGYKIRILKKQREGAQSSGIIAGLSNGFMKDY